MFIESRGLGGRRKEEGGRRKEEGGRAFLHQQ
jgi:hypothetical protein